MTFQPVLPLDGYAGWRFLTRTAERQKELVGNAPITRRETEHFRANISKVKTLDDLMGDRTMLKVALTAFGLESDLPNKAFIRKVLEGSASDPKALANRLADKRYLEMAKTFGFGELGGPFTWKSSLPDKIVGKYRTQTFEVAVGEQSEPMRLALTATRELADIAGRSTTADAMWYTVMGNPPLRKVFETALGLPTSFGALDIDRQLETFRDKAERAFGDGEVKQFTDAGKREDLARLFLVRSQLSQSQAAASGSVALTMLQNMPRRSRLLG